MLRDVETRGWLMRVSFRYEAVPDEEGRTIPPYVALGFSNQGLLCIQIEQKFGGLALRRDAAPS